MNVIEKDFILLIPYYRNFEALVASLWSLCYPWHLFEVLIVDDGSDPPLQQQEITEQFPELKFTIIRLPHNLGILKALNEGLLFLKTKNNYRYIARLDCGDICHPDRFTKQIKFLDEHPDIYLLGTWCRFENFKTKKGYTYFSKTKHQAILKEMHFRCSFIHPTVMFRKEILNTIGLYPEGYPHAEDYAYFFKILKRYQSAILQEVLVTVEMNVNSVSATNYTQQLKARKKVIKTLGVFKLLQLMGLFGLNMRLFLPQRLIQFVKIYR